VAFWAPVYIINGRRPSVPVGCPYLFRHTHLDVLISWCTRASTPRHKLIIRRSDDKPFWIEDKGQPTLLIQYDPDSDTRLSIRVRFDTPDQTDYAEDIRVHMDGQAGDVLAPPSDRFRHRTPEFNMFHTTPDGPWANGHERLIQHLHPFVYGSSTHPYFIHCKFLIYIGDEPGASDGVVFPSTWSKAQIWEHLTSLHQLPDLPQF
jgi:hypothetical protein